MNSNREICIIAHMAIIERVALLYNGNLLYSPLWRFLPATWLVGMETLFRIQISIGINELKP